MTENIRKEILKNLKRVVIKVGTGVISTDPKGSALDRGLSRERI
ncbi:MAG: glutamate 5-kinase, partial [Nitrospinae bacterium]|nr:glutamate 5-kinase [Nitrospinota bacterium]